MFCDPRRWLDVLVETLMPRAWPPPDRRIVRVRLACEGDHVRPLRQFGLDKPSFDPFRNAMNLEAEAPIVGPKRHLRDIVRNVGLRIRIFRQDFLAPLLKVLQQIRVTPHTKPIDGRIADPFVGLCPVLDHAVVVAVLEKAVDVVGDDEIDVQEQHIALDAKELLRPKTYFPPSPISVRQWQIDLGARKTLDLLSNVRRVVG